MSSEIEQSVPVLEDNNRKGLTKGEAIFGDKQAQFEQFSTAPEVVPEATSVIETYEAAKDLDPTSVARSAALIALDNAAARGDWDQQRIQDATKVIEDKYPVKQ